MEKKEEELLLFLSECRNGHLEVVVQLLGKVDPTKKDSVALRRASGRGHLEIVELLLKDGRADPTAWDSEALRHASNRGHVEIVKLLLKDGRADPTAMGGESLYEASHWGYPGVVRCLLQDGRADPRAHDNEALMVACLYGRLEIVKLLLQDGRVDPAANNNRAIRRAYIHDHVEIFKILIQTPNVKKALLEEEEEVEGELGWWTILRNEIISPTIIYTPPNRLKMILYFIGETWTDNRFSEMRTLVIQGNFTTKEDFTMLWDYIMEEEKLEHYSSSSSKLWSPITTPEQKRWIGEIETMKRKIIMTVRKKTDQYGLPIGPLVDILEFSGGVGTQIDMLGPL
jgi:hypothetical protein